VLTAFTSLLTSLFSEADTTASKLTELALSSAVALWIAQGSSSALQHILNLAMTVLSQPQLACLSLTIPENLQTLLRHLKTVVKAPEYTMSDWAVSGSELVLTSAAVSRHLPVVFGGAGGQSNSSVLDEVLSVAAMVCPFCWIRALHFFSCAHVVVYPGKLRIVFVCRDPEV
jgi:hypothetical protein